MKDNFRKALLNIIRFGDTDIFPFPFERYLFDEKLKDSITVLQSIHKKLEDSINNFPPLTLVKLSQVGYYGFRRATMIEPFWNAYYLALVISLADKIEASRLPFSEGKVFSYRYKWDEGKCSLFSDINWIDYKKTCIDKSKSFKYVIQTDISNFYPRINHHKLENELKRIDPTSDIPKRILDLLGIFSGTISYGLPVGGPASRILAELSLNQSDKHLKSRGIEFCRYADDYTIFCNSESDGYKILILLSEKLANDQLSLQKSKTKIMTTEEFREIHQFLDPQVEESISSEEQKLLNISIRFDPYSPTAVDDYETLKTAIQEIDIIGILSKEVNKSKIDQTVTKQAINAITALEKKQQLQAVKVLLDPVNLITLAPVFTSTLRAIRSIYSEIGEEGRKIIDESLLDLFQNESHLTDIELNLNYIIQVLSIQHSQDKEELFVILYPNRFCANN